MSKPKNLVTQNTVIRVTLEEGVETPIEFYNYSGDYLVKNFSEDSVYFAFYPDTPLQNKIKINGGDRQECVTNEKSESSLSGQTNIIYLLGKGEVEVQQLRWTRPEKLENVEKLEAYSVSLGGTDA